MRYVICMFYLLSFISFSPAKEKLKREAGGKGAMYYAFEGCNDLLMQQIEKSSMCFSLKQNLGKQVCKLRTLCIGFKLSAIPSMIFNFPNKTNSFKGHGIF